jgi:DNA-binding response OmpR family regulator
VRIGHLRRQLSNGVTDAKQLLKTVRGTGYMLVSEVTYKDLAL